MFEKEIKEVEKEIEEFNEKYGHMEIPKYEEGDNSSWTRAELDIFVTEAKLQTLKSCEEKLKKKILEFCNDLKTDYSNTLFNKELEEKRLKHFGDFQNERKDM